MDLSTPPAAVAALAAFVRQRLADVSDTLVPLLNLRGDDARRDPRARLGDEHADHSVLAAARQLAMVIVGAAAPFAPTTYSRARLIRQMHASGLLADDEIRQTIAVLEAGEALR